MYSLFIAYRHDFVKYLLYPFSYLAFFATFVVVVAVVVVAVALIIITFG